MGKWKSNTTWGRMMPSRFMQQFLYFLPESQGHLSFLPICPNLDFGCN